MAQKFQRIFYFLRIKIILEAINQGTGTFKLWGGKYWVLVPYTGVVTALKLCSSILVCIRSAFLFLFFY
jgi:hypothetical protein